MKIAIDAMGGDFAPMETVLGSIEAVRANQHIEVVLIGDEQQIFDILEANNEANNPRISVHHASQSSIAQEKRCICCGRYFVGSG